LIQPESSAMYFNGPTSPETVLLLLTPNINISYLPIESDSTIILVFNSLISIDSDCISLLDDLISFLIAVLSLFDLEPSILTS
jgi:hypothetical protein